MEARFHATVAGRTGLYLTRKRYGFQTIPLNCCLTDSAERPVGGRRSRSGGW